MRVYLSIGFMMVLPLLSGCAGTGGSANDLPVHCLDQPARGTCKRRIPRYYYDYPSNTCRMFHYGGCGGHVPFETRSACEEACVADRS